MSLLGQSSNIWRCVYQNYGAVLHAKAATIKDTKKRNKLLALDKWYEEELPKEIASRTEKYITKEELAKLMTWKLAKGKFRPRLQQMVEENSPESVETASKKAFKLLPDLHAAIDALSVLKAVGPATASAVLAAGAPEHAPFMADECLMALPGLEPIKYTLPAYLEYAKEVAIIAQDLKTEDGDFKWTPHLVELTLWTFHCAKLLEIKEVLDVVGEAGLNSAASKEPNSKSQKSGSIKVNTESKSSKPASPKANKSRAKNSDSEKTKKRKSVDSEAKMSKSGAQRGASLKKKKT